MGQPRYLRHDEVLAVHHDLIRHFGGAPGLRDHGLFESAMAASEAGFGGQYVPPDLPDMAAAYLYHLVRNHPFVDGNKRVALAAAHLFLWGNGFSLDTDEEKIEMLVLAAATADASEEEVAKFIRQHMTARPAGQAGEGH